MRRSFFLSPDGADGAPADAPATPAAPAAPVTDGGATDGEPSEPQARPNLRDTIAGQRAALTSAMQPRDESGRFQGRDGQNAEPASAESAPAEGVEPVEGEPTGGEPTGQEPTGGEGTTGEGGEGGEGAGEPIVVALPGRGPDDPDVEIELDDPQVAERVRQLRNDAMRGSEFRERMAAVRDGERQLQTIQHEMQTDPVGFIGRYLSPELQRELAVQVLANPEHFEALQETVYQLGDPDQAELVRQKALNRRYQLQEQLRMDRALQQQAESVRAAVDDLLPAEWDDERRDVVRQNCLTYLGNLLRTGKIATVEAAQIPAILSKQLRAVGIDPVQAADALHRRLQERSQGNGNGSGASATSAGTGRPTARAKAKQRTGPEFVAGQERRRQAAAVSAPSGSVAPAAGGLNLPKNATVKDALNAMRRNIGA